MCIYTYNYILYIDAVYIVYTYMKSELYHLELHDMCTASSLNVGLIFVVIPMPGMGVSLFFLCHGHMKTNLYVTTRVSPYSKF